MKINQWLAIAITLSIPALCSAQQYQISGPARPFNAPAYGNGPQPIYGSPVQPYRAYQDGSGTRMAPSTVLSQSPIPDAAPVESSFVDDSYGQSCDTGACGFESECGACTGDVYFTVLGGLADLDSQTSTGLQRNLEVEFNQGWAIGGAVGKRIGRNFRAELEYMYRSQTPDVVNFNGAFPGNINGQQNAHAGMVNFAYDLVFGNGTFVPYIGAGIGVAGIDSRVRYGSGATLDGDDSSIAYQWMAGMTYRVRPNIEIFAEYRFFEIDDPKLNRFGGPTIGGATPNVLLNSEYVSNDIFTGIRFNY